MVMSPEESWTSRIGRRLRLRDLHVLLAAAQEGSMAKAAQRLSVSQPAVSKALADLEHAIGLRLLDRGPQGVTPTLYGEALLRRSANVFDELRQAVQELDLLANATAGEIRIGCNESLSAALLPDVVDELASTHPGLVLHVTQMVRPITEESRRLRDRSVDLILARGIFPVPEDDLNVEPLFEEPLQVITGAESRWARTPPHGLAELVEARWILYPPGEPPGSLVGDAFRRQGLPPPAAGVTTSSFHMRAALLARGDYVTIVPKCMINVFNADRAAVIALPIDTGIELRPVAIFTLKSRTPNPLVRIVTASIKAVAAKFEKPYS